MQYILAIINYLAFYAIWFLCLWSAEANQSAVAFSLTLLYIILHLKIVSRFPIGELVCILAITTLGFLNESLLSIFHAVQYEGAYSYFLAPLWCVALWAAFASTYWHAFRWLERRYILAAILGALCAPFFYLWIEKAGAATILFSQTFYPYCVISFMWSVVLPLSFFISSKVRGWAQTCTLLTEKKNDNL